MAAQEEKEIDKKEKEKSISGLLIERLSNKIVLSYLISWFICNWKFILFMLFSPRHIEDKLNESVNYISISDWFYPFIGVGIYMIGLNYIETFISYVSTEGFDSNLLEIQKRRKKMVKYEIDIARERLELYKTNDEKEQIEKIIRDNELLKSENEKNAEIIKKQNAQIVESSLPKELFTKSKPTSYGFTTNNEISFSNREIEELAQQINDYGLKTEYLRFIDDLTPKSYGFQFDVQYTMENIELFEKMGLIEKISLGYKATSKGLLVHYHLKTEPFYFSPR